MQCRKVTEHVIREVYVYLEGAPVRSVPESEHFYIPEQLRLVWTNGEQDTATLYGPDGSEAERLVIGRDYVSPWIRSLFVEYG